MPLDPDTIAQQQALVAAHRRTLAHLLKQAAQFGGEVFVPPQTANSITEARANISRIKAGLRENGAPVEDDPNDEDTLVKAPAATSDAHKIAERRNLDAILETYINQMEELLLNRNLRKSQPGDEVRAVARTRTLTALRQLDGEHNRTLIQFLREAGLLIGQSNSDKSVIALSKVNLQGADLQGATLHGINLEEANLEDADLHEADLDGANLEEANLHGANLDGANLDEANLHGANLDGATLQQAILQRADLREADLQGADLRGAVLTEANLQGAILTKANLQGADLQGAFLIETNLIEADLRGANLQEAILQDAKLRGANLHGAILRRAFLSGANLHGTTMPNGSKHK